MTLTIKKYALSASISFFIIISIALFSMPLTSYSGAYEEEPKIEEPGTLAPAPAKAATPTDIGDAYVGEVLVYDMGFWIFGNIAKGVFTLTKEPDGTYKAILDATSEARLFRSTRSTFTALLKKSADNKRFVTIRFEKYSKTKKKIKRIVKVLDHERGILTITKFRGDELRSTEEREISEGTVYDDPLGAFYNLRFGAYGPIKKGGEYLITTFPEKEKEVKIEARIAGDRALKKGIRRWKNNAWILMNAKLDKELFDSSSGDIELYFDEKMVTLNVVAKDVLFFGDIYAKLNRKKSKIPGSPYVPETPSPEDSESGSWDDELYLKAPLGNDNHRKITRLSAPER